jgi:hypothetical protein
MVILCVTYNNLATINLIANKRAKTVYLQPYHNQLRMNKAISGFFKLSKEEK